MQKNIQYFLVTISISALLVSSVSDYQSLETLSSMFDCESDPLVFGLDGADEIAATLGYFSIQDCNVDHREGNPKRAMNSFARNHHANCASNSKNSGDPKNY